MRMNRRLFITAATALCGAKPITLWAQSTPAIHVVKGKGCGCCSGWSSILKSAGFAVTEAELLPAELVQLKLTKGVPQELASCHTAEIDGYVIEGHVPPEDIRQLIAERPDAVGLAVPGMPYGSPGMGPENEREAYEVLLIREDGSSEVFATYAAGSD
jgi:hypothetical protein